MAPFAAPSTSRWKMGPTIQCQTEIPDLLSIFQTFISNAQTIRLYSELICLLANIDQTIQVCVRCEGFGIQLQ